MRWRERDGYADDGNQHDDRNASDAGVPQHARQPGQLHRDGAERERADHERRVERNDDGDYDLSEYGAGGFDGVHDQVLVRGELGTGTAGLRDCGTGGQGEMGMLITTVTLRTVCKRRSKGSSLSRGELESGKEMGKEPLVKDSFVLFRYHMTPWPEKGGRKKSRG
jgi:hypothetical protein